MKKILLLSALVALLLFSLWGCAEEKYPTLSYFVDGELYHMDVLETENEIFDTLSKLPEKVGYYFGGWYYDEGVWEKPLSYTELNQAVEDKEYRVYAKWETVKLEYVESERTYTVVGLLEGAGSEVCIPATYKNIPITKIAAEAFRGNKTLTAVTVPDTVTVIEEYAFAECTALTGIDLPNSVVSIGRGAFSNCVAITKVKLSTTLKSIEAEAFFHCPLLSEVALPESLTKIGARAFASSAALSKVSLPSRLSWIGAEAFAACMVTELSYAGKTEDWGRIAKENFAQGSSISAILCVDGRITVE